MKTGSEVATQNVSRSSRFGERIAPPRDSSLVAHASAPSDDERRRGTPYVPPPEKPVDPLITSIPAPVPLTETEQYDYRQSRFYNAPITPALYSRLVEWYRYAKATGTDHPVNASLQDLQRLKPSDCPDPDPPLTSS